MDLNDTLLAAALALPQRRGYRFEPEPRPALDDPTNPRDPQHDGVSRDLMWHGQTVARGAPDGATFCCGVTFEAWLDAVLPLDPDLDPETLGAMLTDWFCPTMGHSGVVEALVSRGLGRRVSIEEARPGDLCQFWRRTDLANPSGHSVLLLAFEGSGPERIRYWSSQGATEGIGVHVETIGPQWQIHLVRAQWPQGSTAST